METSRKQRWKQLQSVFEPGFKQMLLVSVLLHLLVPALYYAPIFPKREVKKPPVYRVNLVNKIVKKPQSGRPEATVSQKPKPKPKPVKPKPIPPKPKPAPKTIPKPVPVKLKPVPVKPKPEAKKPKVTPTETKPEPKGPSKAQESALEKRLKQLQEARDKKAQEAARKKRLDELKAAAAAEVSQVKSPVDEAPVGMIGGKGDEAGVSALAYVQEFIRQQWSFSKYQALGNPEAEVLLNYNAAGTLIHYKFLRKSGYDNFDESLRRAIAKAKQLPQPLPEATTFEIVFNLKDMLD